MPTKQETFDTVVDHLRTQGQPSIRDGECAYRGALGRRCAAGVLISDEDYKPSMEGHSILVPRGEGTACAAVVKAGHDMVLAQDLQAVHDRTESWTGCGLSDEGEALLRRVAQRHELAYSAPVPQ